jgi:hypothetical protein
MAFSKLSLINDALTHLGANRIVSLTDGSTESAVMNQIYDGAVDAVMRAFPWNCLINRTQLAASTVTPSFEFDYAYPLPTDPYCIRVLQMEETQSQDQWKIEGRNLLTDASTCKIRYIGRPADVGDIDGLLASTIAARLAADASYTLVQSAGFQQNMWGLYLQKMDEARAVDNVESSRDYWVNTKLEEVRQGVTTSGIRFGRAWW